MDHDDYPSRKPRNDVWDDHTQERDADVKKDFLAFPKSACWTVDKFWLSSGGGTNRERKGRNSTAVDFQNFVFDFPDGPRGAYEILKIWPEQLDGLKTI